MDMVYRTLSTETAAVLYEQDVADSATLSIKA